MKNLPLFIALKYLRSKKTGFLSFVSNAGFIGIALGVAVLILVSSVFNGFEREMRDRVLQAIPHASIDGNIKLSEVEAIQKILKENTQIIGSAPYIETQALLSSSNSLKGAYIFGIVPNQEEKVSLVSKSLINGNWKSLEEEKYGILIGDILAFQMGVGIGDMINVMVPDTSVSLVGILPRTKRFKVTGIFSLGAPEIDHSYTFINIKNAGKLLRMEDSVHGVRIKYQDLFKARELIFKDRKRINQNLSKQYYSTNWTNTYGTLFKAINMEKFLVSLLLSFVVLVAIFNVVSLSVMTINERRAQIAILMTIGANRMFVQKVFIYFGLIIGMSGTLIGLGVGLILTYFLTDIVNLIEGLLGISFLEVYFIPFTPTKLPGSLSICIVVLLIERLMHK